MQTIETEPTNSPPQEIRPRARTITVDGVALAYDDEGTGPTLLCLHAIGHAAEDYAVLRGRYAERFRVVALDWPGHGRSSTDTQPVSAKRFANLLSGFVEALGLTGITLLGNSIGGAAAIRLAAMHPERVRGLVLANPGGLAPFARTTRWFTGALACFFDAGSAGARWYPWAFAALYRRLLRGPFADTRRAAITASGVTIAPLLAQAWRSFGEPDADLRALAATVQARVLVTWGTHDPVNPLWINLDAVRRFANVRLERFDAGHAAFLETPHAFDRVFADWYAAAP